MYNNSECQSLFGGIICLWSRFLGHKKKQTNHSDVLGLIYVATWQLLLREVALSREKHGMRTGASQPTQLSI